MAVFYIMVALFWMCIAVMIICNAIKHEIEINKELERTYNERMNKNA